MYAIYESTTSVKYNTVNTPDFSHLWFPIKSQMQSLKSPDGN